MNKGEPFSNKPIKKIKTSKGNKNINPVNENMKSNKRIILMKLFFR